MILTVIAGALAGCGGSGGPVQESPPVGEYATLSSNASIRSVLIGNALRQGGEAQENMLVSISGSMRHASGRIAVTDGQISLIDNDGFDGDGLILDSESYLLIDRGLGDHEYSLAYQQSYEWNGETYDSVGVIGIGTLPEDIPVSGTAQYTGPATGLIIVSEGAYDLLNGTSNFEVDFSTSEIGLELTNFEGRDHFTGGPVALPIDLIRVSGITIEQNTWGGGGISTFQGATSIDLVGSNPTSNTGGAFFGFEGSNGQPAEVGGVFVLEGEDGFVTGSFIAE